MIAIFFHTNYIVFNKILKKVKIIGSLLKNNKISSPICSTKITIDSNKNELNEYYFLNITPVKNKRNKREK
jgi:hypothetical protein